MASTQKNINFSILGEKIFEAIKQSLLFLPGLVSFWSDWSVHCLTKLTVLISAYIPLPYMHPVFPKDLHLPFRQVLLLPFSALPEAVVLPDGM